MKKRILTAIAFALAAFMAFTACSNSTKPAGESSDSAPTAEAVVESSSQPPSEPSSENEAPEAQPDEPEEAEGDAVNITVFATAMQDGLDALSEIYGDAVKIEVSTQGDNTLILTYTLLNDSLGINLESIEENMKAEGSKMEDLAKQMESAGIPSPVVVIKWINTDGSELYNQEFK